MQRFTLFGRFSGISLIRLERLRSSASFQFEPKTGGNWCCPSNKIPQEEEKEATVMELLQRSRSRSGNAAAVDTVSSELDAKEQTTALIASRGGKQNQSKHFHIIIGPKTFLFPQKTSFRNFMKKSLMYLSRWLVFFKTFQREVLRELQNKTWKKILLAPSMSLCHKNKKLGHQGNSRHTQGSTAIVTRENKLTKKCTWRNTGFNTSRSECR